VEIHPLESPPPRPGPLGGAGIVVTRPVRQAAGLVRRLAALGAAPIVWPAIVILPPADAAALAHVQRDLATYDIAVFVSANAVEFGVGSGLLFAKFMNRLGGSNPSDDIFALRVH